MDSSKFMEVYDGPNGGTEVDAKEALRRSLKGSSRRYYVDVSGDGTHYVCSGNRHGIGYARCDLILTEDDLVTLTVTSVSVPERDAKSLDRLCRYWNSSFILDGLTVRDGKLCFICKPFDPTVVDTDDAVGKALSTVHEYASAPIALAVGIDPWDLLEFDDMPNGRSDDDEDDDDGESLMDDMPGGLGELLRMVRAHAS